MPPPQLPYAALLADLDGTLAADETISPRVAAAVRRVAQLVPVSIATGRRTADVVYYARQLGLTAPQISNGGATLIDPVSAELLWNSSLPQVRARQIIGLAEDWGMPFIATHPAGDTTTVAGISHWDLTRISAMDLPESRADQLAAQFSDASDLHVVKVYLHYNGWWAVDFTAAGVHKGEAAAQLARRLGVKPAQIIAAGDSFNDLPMLEIAGLSIVMASAPPELRSIAHYVAPPVEADGLAVAIEEVVLPALLP